MLKIKKLQILGFKSFCDRTEMNFHGEGLAAIVGPNGCGKSNIADAIAWVLGEQSAKSLRGGSMSDVIFMGSRDRKPTGMAEVSLTLVDPSVYEGREFDATNPQIEIKDELPEDDWDEAVLRTQSAKATEAYTLATQPGVLMDKEGHIVQEAESADEIEGEEKATAEEIAEATAEAAAENSGPSEVTTSTETESTAHHTSATQAVVLKIRRRKFTNANMHAGEIVITRRLFRSGASEYLLNGKICRLRDIQDIFMGTGLGPESYAIIEQGRIGQILSTRPHDRRAIIEEAAGITRYKTKKRLAESRLEQSKVNLNRINDIFDEVTRQMASLKRQAAKAERYAKLRDELRDKLRIVLASKFAQMAAETTRVDAEMQQLGEEIRVQTESVQQMEQEHHAGTQRGYALEQDTTAARDTINTLQLESERCRTRFATNEERCAELDVRIAGTQAELERGNTQLSSLTIERDANRTLLESATAETTAARQLTENRRQEAAHAGSMLVQAEQEQEARRAEIMRLVSEGGLQRNRIAQSEEHIASLTREGERLEREIAAAMGEVEHFGGRRGQLGLVFESANQSVIGLQSRISDVRGRLNSARDAENHAKNHRDGLRAEHATALGKRNSLEAVIQEHGYSTESVKRLFQSGALHGSHTPAGVLADFLEVDPQYENVVEDFLRDELNYVVVKSWDAAEEGMRVLQTGLDGRATFLVHPSDSQARFSFDVDESRKTAQTSQAPNLPVTPLTRCVRVLNGFGRSLEVILPKLGSGYITPDASTARNMALGNPDAFFLSPNGETFHNVTVTGGKQRTEGPLTLKRELREVCLQLGDLERALRDEEMKISMLSQEIGEMTVLLTRLEEELRTTEKEAISHSHALQQMESEITRAQQRMDSQRLENDRILSLRAEKETELSGLRARLAANEAQRGQRETESTNHTEVMNRLRGTRDAAIQAASEASIALASLEERLRGAQGVLERMELMVAEVSQRVATLESQMASAQAEKEQRTRENVELTERLTALVAEQSSASARAEALQVESTQLRLHLAELDQQLQDARKLLDTVREHRSELATTLARLQSDIQHLGETCLNELNQQADELRSDLTIALIEGEALTLEDENVRQMRARLEAMGPVNMMALEEYKEIAERHAVLETQRKDLLDAIENTQKTIAEIELLSKQLFEEAFHKINENFQFTFRKLFGGGQGFMRLTDETDQSESGIDLVASPPGKKMQNALLLSGGEKAMVALALLVGIFQYKPSPFCLLDEVDAPLDEANVGRFTELVREMSNKTQFIVITHNKRTMNASPVLYGVTMQEQGVSKLVTVKFGETAA